jgi:hypothetical protein
VPVRAIAFLFALLSVISEVRGDKSRVLLVQTPEPVLAAARTALQPWRCEIATSDAKPPPATMPDASVAARALAEEHGAQVVVWLSEGQSGAALWTYDHKSDHVVVRHVEGSGEIDEVRAAGIALTIKTLLRHSSAAPEEERFGAAAAPEEESAEADASPTQPPHGAAAPAARWRLEAFTGFRYTSSEAETTQLRLGLGVGLRIRSDLEALAQLRVGTGLAVRSAEVSGHYRISTLSLGARYLRDLSLVEAGAQLGLSLHFGGFRGTLTGGGEVSDRRINPSMDGAVLVRRWVTPRVGIGLGFGASVLLKRQRFLARGQPILTLPQVDWMGGLWFFVPLS